MLQKLKDYIFRLRAKQYLAERTRERRFVNYDKAATILILFESDYQEKNAHIRQIISRLQQDGKKVTAWGFVDKKEVMTSILPDFRILHHKQTDFFQKPVLSYLNELETMEFDLLIDLSVNRVLPLMYISLHANALFKVGKSKTDLTVYDFVINADYLPAIDNETAETVTPIDDVYLFEQIIFYLKSIQTND